MRTANGGMEEQKGVTKDMEAPLFFFRVLSGKESAYNVWAARCLETGSVATADDADTAEDMIKELLVDEVMCAIERNNLSNLYSSPAPFDVWMRFRDTSQNRAPSKQIRRVAIQTRGTESISTEIAIVRAA